MIEIFLQYYGMDWVSAFTTILGMYYLSDQNRIGFLFNIAGLISGTIVYVVAGSVPLMLLNVALFFINLRGYMKWKRSDI